MKGKNRLISAAFMGIILALTAFSGKAQVEGNGNVVKVERKVSGFKAVAVSNGINLLVSQGSEEKVVVEAEENLIQYIRTEVSDETLRIGIHGNNGSFNSHKKINVYVTAKELNALEANSGSRLKSENRIKTGNLKISSSSGSSIIVEVACVNLDASASSGSSGIISGSAATLTAEGSSGSSLVASELVAEKGNISASSGSVVVVHITKEIKADASSGGRIVVSGNPAIKDTDSSSGGSVHFK